MEKKRGYKMTEHGDNTMEHMRRWYKGTEYKRRVTGGSDNQCMIDGPSLGGASIFFFLVLLPLGRPRGLFPG